MFVSELIHKLRKFENKIAIKNGSDFTTYKALDMQSDIIAVTLVQNNIRKDSIVGVIVNNKADFIKTIIGILKAGCCFMPIDPLFPLIRKKEMIAHTNTTVIISDNNNYREIKDQSEFKGISIINFNQVELSSDNIYLNEPINNVYPYIYFTSGSSGVPKAILGKAQSLLHFINWEIENFHIGNSCNFSQFISVSFDAFLRDIFVPIFSGGTIVIPENFQKMLSPSKLIEWIERQAINIIHTVPSLFRVFNSYRLNEDNFKNIKYIFLSGEALNPNELKNWLNLFADRVSLVNFYGTSETTMIKSFYIINKNDYKNSRIPIGKPMRGARILLFNKNMQLCNEFELGRLYIRTPFMTYGYLNNSELTAEKFVQNWMVEKSDLLYDTGDIGRYLSNGDVELLGREDREVKVRGVRINPQEIENCVFKLSFISNVYAFKDKNEQLVLVYSIAQERIKDKIDFTETIRSELTLSLSSDYVPSVYFKVDDFPLTATGKTDVLLLEKLCENNHVENESNYFIEGYDRLLKIWKRILKANNISIDVSFFHIGGNSLNVLKLIEEIYSEYKISLEIKDIFTNNTIKSQADLLFGKEKSKPINIKKSEKKKYYNLSSAQQRLFILQNLQPQGILYNMPQVFQVYDVIDCVQFEKSLIRLVNRYNILRTVFKTVNGTAKQVVREKVNSFSLKVIESQDKFEAKEKITEFISPFNLEQDILVRAALIKVKDSTNYLILDTHHIISDLFSVRLLIKELFFIYRGDELTKLDLQYTDYSEWNNQWKNSETYRNQEEYWKNQFCDDIPKINLPVDYNRPSVKSTSGDTIKFEINKTQVDYLREISAENSATLFMTLYSLFNLFLFKISSDEDLIVGIPIEGRKFEILNSQIGMFVNTLAIRNKINPQSTFVELIAKVKERLIEAYENQDLQFEDLVSKVVKNRDTSHNPIFDISFVFKNYNEEFENLEEISNSSKLRAKSFDFKMKRSKFDLTLICAETQDKLLFEFEYSTKIFKKSTIEKFIVYFKRILTSIASNSNMQINQIEIISDEEKKKSIELFNKTKIEYPYEKSVDELFMAYCLIYPDKYAIIDSDNQKITYKDLDILVDRVSSFLLNAGIKSNDVVIVNIKRGIPLIAGILGVLRAGGTYVPLDVSLPNERKKYIIDHSNAKCIISQSQIDEIESVSVYQIAEILREELKRSKNLNKRSKNAYILYTSGTTGKPKGVVITQKSLLNYVCWAAKQYLGNEEMTFAFFTSISFDLTVTSLFVPLITGNTIYVYPEEDGFILDRVIKENRAQIIKLTPSHLKILNEGYHDLSRSAAKVLIVGGEEFNSSLALEIHQKFKGKIDIYNEYGPTEATVGCMIYKFDSNDKNRSVSIGKPIDNTRIYLLDKYFKPVPVGIIGEIYIGGDCLAEGYLSNTKLTTEKFIQNKYADGRVYKTGDCARMLENGNIEFIGRYDDQVKIRGYRVELSEIEKELKKHPKVSDAIVMVEDDSESLNAYLITEKSLELNELRIQLSESLPTYMIPTAFYEIDALPITTNGKLDKAALSALRKKIQNSIVYTIDNEIENKLSNIWKAVLGHNHFGKDDSFFEIGGDSLKLISVNRKIEDDLKKTIQLVMLFKYTTINSLAGFLSEDRDGFEEQNYQESVELINETISIFFQANLLNEE